MNEEILLSALGVGQSARVCRVRPGTAMQRRFLDIGFIPGTRVTCVGKSPAGDPAAYAVRGAVIALRKSDAADIQLEAPGMAAVPLELSALA